MDRALAWLALVVLVATLVLSGLVLADNGSGSGLASAAQVFILGLTATIIVLYTKASIDMALEMKKQGEQNRSLLQAVHESSQATTRLAAATAAQADAIVELAKRAAWAFCWLRRVDGQYRLISAGVGPAYNIEFHWHGRWQRVADVLPPRQSVPMDILCLSLPGRVVWLRWQNIKAEGWQYRAYKLDNRHRWFPLLDAQAPEEEDREQHSSSASKEPE